MQDAQAVFAAPLPPAPLESASIVVNQAVLRDTQSLALMSRSQKQCCKLARP